MSCSKLGFEEYRQWIIKNVEILSQLETLGRLGSYIIAGRMKKSPVVSELLYSLTNIIVFVNDQILIKALKASRENPIPNEFVDKSRVILTLLEYLQVFLELTASRLWGSIGKWTVIVAIQTVKFVWRILVVFTQNNGLAALRPIPTLNRKKLLKEEHTFDRLANSNANQSNATFSLKSGRVIRNVKGAPDIQRRNWKLPKPLEINNDCTISKKLTGSSLLGEVLYICKPLCHLMAMRKFGVNSWIAWGLALAVDVSSLKLLKSGVLSSDDVKEVNRRQLALLMYLLRSPFYDTFSRRAILKALNSVKGIPIVGLLRQPILNYLLYWQKIYFYVWD